MVTQTQLYSKTGQSPPGGQQHGCLHLYAHCGIAGIVEPPTQGQRYSGRIVKPSDSYEETPSAVEWAAQVSNLQCLERCVKHSNGGSTVDGPFCGDRGLLSFGYIPSLDD